MHFKTYSTEQFLISVRKKFNCFAKMFINCSNLANIEIIEWSKYFLFWLRLILKFYSKHLICVSKHTNFRPKNTKDNAFAKPGVTLSQNFEKRPKHFYKLVINAIV